MGLKLQAITAFIFVLIQAWCCNSCWEDERFGLLQLQPSFNKSLFLFEESANCCDWGGIECDVYTGRVTYLGLSGARDSDLGDWYLNVSLFLPFKQLSHLDLSRNGIAGCLQSEGFERLTELNKLEYLDLSFNNFNNNILSSLRGLSSLKLLEISYNKLKGSIYLKELASLKNLEELTLSGNKNISKFVTSKDIRCPANLNSMYLDEMTSNGMPLLLKSLGLFSCFNTLYLMNNNLTGATFHRDSQSFKSTENLYLDGSVVDENFLLSLDALPSLKSLSFSGGYGLDNLHGLCNLDYIQSLDLRDNNLTGRLSPCLANLTSLQYLDLSFNSLTGDLASSPFTSMTSIQNFNLVGNNFRIPLSLVPFYNCSNLFYLNIYGNEVYAEIESHNLIPKFQLGVLYMIGNGDGGSFPKFLYSQHNLQQLHLGDNKLKKESFHIGC